MPTSQSRSGHFHTEERRYIVEPDEGKSLSLGGFGVIYKVRGNETGGAFSIVEHPIEPGRLVTPHVHEREDEISYVLEGDLGFRVGEKEFPAPRGSYVFKPRNIPHTFWNSTDKPAKVLEIISPAGFEAYFEELGNIIGPGGRRPSDLDSTAMLGRKYGNAIIREWIDELKSKYHLKMLGEL